MQAPNATPSVLADFTRQEQKIMSLILDGFSCQEIATELNISKLTVKTHKQNIAHKAEVKGAPALRKFVISKADDLKNTPFILL